MHTKTCKKCGETKEIKEFFKNKRWTDGFDNHCKACVAAQRKERYWRNPEASRERGRKNQKKFREQNPQYQQWYEEQMPGGRTEYFRRANRLRTYGLSQEAFESLLESQDGRCAICKCSPKADDQSRSWQVDHDHKTGIVRGLLCKHCNWALGHFADSVERLESAIAYLRKQEEP